MNIMPGIKKIGLSAVVTILWYFILTRFIIVPFFSLIACYPEPSQWLPDLLPEVIIPGCPRTVPVAAFLSQLSVIILPGLLVYLFLSLREKRK